MLRVSYITHPCSRGCSVPEFWQAACMEDTKACALVNSNCFGSIRTVEVQDQLSGNDEYRLPKSVTGPGENWQSQAE
jgi:hypothetical protein